MPCEADAASFGAALAAPDQRTVLITGEGSHQLTAQESSQFHRFGLKPLIFVLNNDGYLIERLLCQDPESYYNDLAKWNYHKLPEALGCDGWLTARVTTCGELRRHNQKGGIVGDRRLHRGGNGSLRRVATGKEDTRFNC
jgi:indolepyruvate decarboxylase